MLYMRRIRYEFVCNIHISLCYIKLRQNLPISKLQICYKLLPVVLVSIFAAGIINLHCVGCDCRQWDNRIMRYQYLYRWTVTANLSLDLVHRWHIPASLHVRHRLRRIQVALIRDRKPKGSKFLTFSREIRV